ncbi:AEC family transporter [Viridibacterium curvum]|uniref:AEC family transporter n=1 Tax=Viridibacterium curvum TaxID=1101404 RepID=A0ABP9Q8V3_9RHOO
MLELLQRAELTLPLFILIALGYALMRWGHWPKVVADALTRFVFALALPALLFHTMSDMSRLPPVDMRVLIAFFGSCLIVFAIGRLVAARFFALDGVSGSVFALGGVFSNNAMLGIPLARELIGPAAMPTVALVLVFNALTLWTLVTISVEWARHGALSIEGFGKTARNVMTNPLIVGILSGALIGLTGWTIPKVIDAPISMLAQAAAPLSLIALGMGLAEFGVRAGWQHSTAITSLKLVVQPLVIWLLARLMDLPKVETQAVVLLGSIAVGANVYLMSRQFKVMEGAIASALVLTTVLSVVSTPLALTLAAF